jgi:hypothetical protein
VQPLLRLIEHGVRVSPKAERCTGQTPIHVAQAGMACPASSSHCLSSMPRSRLPVTQCPQPHTRGEDVHSTRVINVNGGEEEGGGVRSGPGAARTIPLFHTISARPPKQPRMVGTFLKVHTRPRLAYALRCRGY